MNVYFVHSTSTTWPLQNTDMRVLLGITSILFVCVYGPMGSAQGELEVDVELVIAVDVSRSMTPRELEIQRRGYAEALVSEEVLEAIAHGFLGQVAITYVEWAGSQLQRVVIDWTLVRDRADAEAFVARLTARFDSTMRRTSISGALDFAAAHFERNGFSSLRRVIDISGDGPNNQGRPVEFARDDALAKGIVINGLPLMTREGMGSQWHLDDLDDYYRRCVIGGPTSFMIPVLEWNHFPQAVRRKLVLDLVRRRQVPDSRAKMVRAASDEYDCLIGERIWEDIQGDWN